jgi:hypothetical protein
VFGALSVVRVLIVITLEVDLKPMHGMSHYLVIILLSTPVLNIYTASRGGKGVRRPNSTTISFNLYNV